MRLVMAVVVTTAILSVWSLFAVGSGKLQDPEDWYTPYHNMYIGMSYSDVYGCAEISVMSMYVNNRKYCTVEVDDTQFVNSVYLQVTDGIVDYIAMSVNLSLGQLVEVYGRADEVRVRGLYVRACWNAGLYALLEDRTITLRSEVKRIVMQQEGICDA